MKRLLGFAIIIAVFSPSVHALDDIEMQPARKRLDLSKDRERGNTSVREDEIIYSVKVNSRSFKTLPLVKIKYNIFYEVSTLGSTAEPEVKVAKGSHELTDLQTNKPVEFETEAIKLAQAALDGNWYFTNGASRKVRDKVVGLWFKAFDSEGNLLGEYVNPSSTSKKQKWAD